MIRITLIGANLALLVLLGYLTHKYGVPGGDGGGFFFYLCFALAIANPVYIWTCRPGYSRRWRVFKLVSLWLDAKEADLKKRVEQQQPPRS